MAALMQRYGGHPYDTMDNLPFNVVDPVKKTPLENLWAMGHNRNELVSSARGGGEGDERLGSFKHALSPYQQAVEWSVATCLLHCFKATHQ